jgi:general secretion pathway protein D
MMRHLTMRYKRAKYLILFLFILAGASVHGQTIAEKKSGVVSGGSELSPEMQKFLGELNHELQERQSALNRLQDKVIDLYDQDAPETSYRELLVQINDAKENIRILQESWREMVTKPGMKDEGYALWHQPETTLEQLIIDYGSLDYVYLIPTDIAGIKVSISSNIPIPHASWGEMLEQILLQSGVGIKELNPYLRKLYMVKNDFSTVRLITNNPLDLEAYPGNARVSYVLSPEPMDVKRIWFFLEKFINPNSTVLQRIGRVILITGEVNAIKDLLKIYDFVTANKRELEYKAVPLFRVEAEEMAKILATIFEQFAEDEQVEEVVPQDPDQGEGAKAGRPVPPRPTATGRRRPRSDRNDMAGVTALTVIALPKVAQAVFLLGTAEEIKKAEDIIREVERQVGAARDKSIFSYTVKHSDPEELAQVLAKIYQLMIEHRVGFQTKDVTEAEQQLKDQVRDLEGQAREEIKEAVREERETIQRNIPYPTYFQPPFYQQGAYTVNPAPIETRPGVKDKKVNVGRENFIVDPKTSHLIMVVETDILPKLKEIISKLDVPKKMVQIEVLLFERILQRDLSYGLNLLKIGSAASQLHRTSAVFAGGLDQCEAIADANTIKNCGRGVLDFFISRTKSSSGIPAFDLAYKFLMSQDNVYLTASPSVVTVNQTEAVISIQDERSILVGTNLSNTPGVTAQNVFTRAQYGITIRVTPTVHWSDPEDFFEDPENYINLVSEITFDTIPPGQDNSNQPQVNRRQIINEVNIPDGQAVIIGGLRRKQGRDSSDKVPFLGEIPGLGKLFSTTELSDEETELVIFMTPKIIANPREDFYRLRREHLCRRPGDLPCFIAKLNEALEREKNRAFQGYMTILFGPPRPRYICEEAEYDGR